MLAKCIYVLCQRAPATIFSYAQQIWGGTQIREVSVEFCIVSFFDQPNKDTIQNSTLTGHFAPKAAPKGGHFAPKRGGSFRTDFRVLMFGCTKKDTISNSALTSRIWVPPQIRYFRGPHGHMKKVGISTFGYVYGGV